MDGIRHLFDLVEVARNMKRFLPSGWCGWPLAIVPQSHESVWKINLRCLVHDPRLHAGIHPVTRRQRLACYPPCHKRQCRKHVTALPIGIHDSFAAACIVIRILTMYAQVHASGSVHAAGIGTARARTICIGFSIAIAGHLVTEFAVGADIQWRSVGMTAFAYTRVGL